MKINIVQDKKLAIAVSLVLLTNACADQKQQAQAWPYFDAYRASSKKLCEFGGEGVNLSPSGKHAVFYQDIASKTTVVGVGRRLSILNLDCAFKTGAEETCMTGAEAYKSVRALAWDKNERGLYLVENGQMLSRMVFDAQTGQGRIGQRIPIDKQVATTSVVWGAIPSDTAETAAAYLAAGKAATMHTAVPGDMLMGLFMDSHGPIGALVENFHGLDLAVLTSNARTPTAFKGVELPQGKLTRPLGSAGLPWLSDVGIAPDMPAGALPPFAKPLIASNNGRLLGYFDKARLYINSTAKGAKSLEAAVAEALGKHPGFYIHDLATSDGSDYGLILKKVNAGKVIVLSRSGRRFLQSCPANNTAGEPTDFSLAQLSLGADDWPLHGLMAKASGTKGLVVFFRGGPRGTIANLDSNSIREYMDAGWNVLAVNYSGNLGTGSGVSSRLRTQGMVEAMRKDAEYTASFIRKLNPAGQLVIHGESLGGPLAKLTSDALEVPHRLVLIAPLLRLQPPEHWVGKSGTPFSPRPNLTYQKNFEAAMLGVSDQNRAASQLALDGLYKVKSDSRLSFAAYAREDLVSQPAHGQFVADQVLMLRGGHDFVTAHPELWSAVFAWLGSPPRPVPAVP
ncbi:hypothetical protein [Chitinimonas sp. JJ19]|uniref:hypothetical protein n=1 Tax=Chitinimonas sp. JJ19 TaxID=3109352 RepID=UPI0030033608